MVYPGYTAIAQHNIAFLFTALSIGLNNITYETQAIELYKHIKNQPESN
jgi:hypothetical protein